MNSLRKITLASAFGTLVNVCFASQDLRFVPPYADRVAPIEYQVEGGDDKNFRYLAVQCWMPPSGEVRGILCVVLHPDGVNGRVLADPEPWRQLAVVNHCALLGVSIVESADPTNHWSQARKGSGHALLEAIEHFAETSGHAELARAPIALAGVCAAGQFAYEFAAFAPSRTSCFVTIGGAKHIIEHANEAAGIPALLVATPDRGAVAVANLDALYRLGKQLGARWSKDEGEIALYDTGKCQPLVASFLDRQLCNGRAKINSGKTDSFEEGGMNHKEKRGYGFRSSPLPSFLGKPLQIFARLSSSPAEVKIMPGKDSSKIAFRIQSENPGKFDAISIPHAAIDDVETVKIGSFEWEISVILRASQIPSGSFNFELPVRFSENGKSRLGGNNIPIRGTVERDIYSSPRILRLSSGGASGKPVIRLKTRSGLKIRDLEVEAVDPPGVSVSIGDEDSDGPRVLVAGQQGLNEAAKPIVGYIILRARSADFQSVKIPFYGILTP